MICPHCEEPFEREVEAVRDCPYANFARKTDLRRLQHAQCQVCEDCHERGLEVLGAEENERREMARDDAFDRGIDEAKERRWEREHGNE